MLEIIGYLMIILGLIIMLIGLIGLIKFQNFYSRILISSIIDTASYITIIIGIIFIKGIGFFSLKIILISSLMLFLNPLSTHTIARNAHISGLKIGDDN